MKYSNIYSKYMLYVTWMVATVRFHFLGKGCFIPFHTRAIRRGPQWCIVCTTLAMSSKTAGRVAVLTRPCARQQRSGSRDKASATPFAFPLIYLMVNEKHCNRSNHLVRRLSWCFESILIDPVSGLWSVHISK